MPASYKTCPPYPAGVVYSLLIGPKTIGLTALTLSLAHAPNRETLPLSIIFLYNYFGVSSCNPLHYVGNRFDSVNHSRFRCNNNTLNHDLFIINCVVSPACPHCNAPVEDVKHYFLYCPIYASHRITLFTSAAHILGDKWLLASDKKKIECFLFGSPVLQFRMFVYLSKFSHLFPIHLVFLCLAL